MNRNISVSEMLNRFLFVVSKSRVIDWPKIDSGSYVYGLSELKTWLGKDKVDAWLHHRDCKAFDTLEQAIRFAYDRARVLAECSEIEDFVDMPMAFVEMVSIDVDAMIENQIRRLQAERNELRRYLDLKFHVDPKGQIALLDPPPKPPLPIETPEERLEDAIRARDVARQEYEQKRAEALANRARRRAEAAQNTDSGPS